MKDFHRSAAFKRSEICKRVRVGVSAHTHAVECERRMVHLHGLNALEKSISWN